MKKGMTPALVGGGCGNPRGSPTGPPASSITPAPPAELLLQNLQKRAEVTCGFSSTDFYGCPLNSYCVFYPGYGRWDCCTISSNSAIAATCNPNQTVCFGSAASLAAYGTGKCANGVACCPSSDGPECVTAILSLNPTLMYSSFFCSQVEATIQITQIADYVAQTSTSVITQPASVVTQSASTFTESPSTVTITPSTVTITPSTSSSSSTSSTSTTSSIISSSSSSSIPSPISSPSSNHVLDISPSAAASSASSASAITNNASQATESTFDQHKGGIIGGTVGGILLLLLIALAFIVRHRMGVKKREAGLYGGQEMSGRVVSDGIIYSSVPGGRYGN